MYVSVTEGAAGAAGAAGAGAGAGEAIGAGVGVERWIGGFGGEEEWCAGLGCVRGEWEVTVLSRASRGLEVGCGVASFLFSEVGFERLM